MKLGGRNGNETVRSQLISNREERDAHKRRLYVEPFGIYRPLTERSLDRLNPVLRNASNEVNRTVLSWKDGRGLEAHDEMGVTFVRKKDISRAMGAGSIRRNFDFGQMARSMQTEAVLQPGNLEVPINYLAWVGIGGATLAASTFHLELSQQADVIQDVLTSTNAEIRQVNDPNHVSLFRYGTYKEVLRERAMDDELRDTIADVVSEHLNDAGIYEVELGPVIVGTSYTTPHPLLTTVG